VALTVALEVLLLLHAPPEAVFDNVILVPAHTDEAPVIEPASGSGFTVTTLVPVAVPQLLVTEYDMVATPPAKPLTIPVDAPTDATVGLPLFHEPPEIVLDNVIEDPAQTEVGPERVPALAPGLTAMLFITTEDPQLLVTV
jgi:hypothetical protein